MQIRGTLPQMYPIPIPDVFRLRFLRLRRLLEFTIRSVILKGVCLPGLLRRVPEVPRGGRGGSAGAAQEPATEPRHAAVRAGVGHAPVVGRAAVRGRAHRVHGGLHQVLRRAHAELQPQAAACQVTTH